MVTALALVSATGAYASTIAKATGKQTAKIVPATQAQCDGWATAIDLSTDKASNTTLRRVGTNVGCTFVTVTSGSVSRTKGKAGGSTKYGQRAATQAECDIFAGAIDIVTGLLDNPANHQYIDGLNGVLSEVNAIGDAMGCVFTSAA